MLFYVLRHAIAIDRDDPACPKEAERFLTDYGRVRMKQVGQAFPRLRIRASRIYTSPWKRALNTAEIAQDTVGGELIVTEDLIPSGDMMALLERINQDNMDDEPMMIVGHEPYLSHLISVLLTGRGDLSIELKKAGVCALQIDRLKFGQCADLLWLLKPSQMVKMVKEER